MRHVRDALIACCHAESIEMPIPIEFLTKCKVYTDCLKCGKTLKSTRGERSHLQQCCFDEFVQRSRPAASDDAASDAYSAGAKRTHSQCASSVASNSCTGSVQPVQNGTQMHQDSVLQLEVTGGHVSTWRCMLKSCFDVTSRDQLCLYLKPSENFTQYSCGALYAYPQPRRQLLSSTCTHSPVALLCTGCMAAYKTND